METGLSAPGASLGKGKGHGLAGALIGTVITRMLVLAAPAQVSIHVPFFFFFFSFFFFFFFFFFFSG